MDVSIFPSLLRPGQVQQSLEDRLIDLVARATSPDTDDDEYEDIVDEVLKTILNAGSYIFSEAAPTPSTDSIDLHSLVFPLTYVFRLEIVDDNATIVRIDPEEEYTSSFLDRDEDGSFKEDFYPNTTLPVHSTSKILIQELYVQGAGYTAALV
ncbi:hypothetical protein Purlil1_9311 [Purpureocillium lilacinum]|uniref:Uncharacterized protein n=1 Tax=Purpureocillium lilacinum TaxID=33203 RepID=A0ABR0BR10_PURLI|nr:hypothetical protein Purlil1_9311 [Purpureocillium lilacinum]